MNNNNNKDFQNLKISGNSKEEARYYSHKSEMDKPVFRTYLINNYGFKENNYPNELSNEGLRFWQISQESYLRWKKEKEIEEKFKSIPENIKEILTNPNFLDIIDVEFEKKIVGENDARKTIFLVANMRNVENLSKGTDNLIVNAISGTGKDYICESIFEIIPDHEKEELNKTTPKVLAYTRNKFKDVTATWKKTVLRLEDVSDNVVNDDTFKVFQTANPNKLNIGKTMIKQKVVEIGIEGKPSIIMTIANPNIRDEGLRRNPTLFLDEGINQTKEIIKRQAQFAKEGKSIEYDDDIKKALSFLQRIKVKIPYADLLVKIFENSTQTVIIRTAFSRFLDYIRSSCSLHQFNRRIDEEGYHLAEKQDYEIACLCLKKTTSNILMIPLNKLDTEIYEFFKENHERGFSLDELLDFEKIQILGKSDRWIRYRLDFLVSKGFLRRWAENVQGSFKPVNKYLYQEVGNFQLPSFEELLKNTSNTSNGTNTTINTNTTNNSNTNIKNENIKNDFKYYFKNLSLKDVKRVNEVNEVNEMFLSKPKNDDKLDIETIKIKSGDTLS